MVVDKMSNWVTHLYHKLVTEDRATYMAGTLNSW